MLKKAAVCNLKQVITPKLTWRQRKRTKPLILLSHTRHLPTTNWADMRYTRTVDPNLSAINHTLFKMFSTSHLRQLL